MNRNSESVRNTKNVLWDEKQAADYLGLNHKTLTAWRTNKRYNLPYIKCGRLVRYRVADVEAFLESRTVAGLR